MCSNYIAGSGKYTYDELVNIMEQMNCFLPKQIILHILNNTIMSNMNKENHSIMEKHAIIIFQENIIMI